MNIKKDKKTIKISKMRYKEIKTKTWNKMKK